jgi:MFS family permease
MQSSLSPWLQAVFGFGSFEAGLVFFFIGAVSAFTQAVLLPLLSKKFSRISLAVVGVVCFVGGLGVLSVFADLAVLALVAFVVSLGFGIQFVTYNTLISLNTPENAQGGSLGVAWAVAGAAQSIAPVLATSVFTFGLSVGFVGLAFVVAALVGVAILPLILYFKKIST